MKQFELDRVDVDGNVLSTVVVTEEEAKAIHSNPSIAKNFAKEARPVGKTKVEEEPKTLKNPGKNGETN